MFIAAASELRALDQAFILLGHQVALHLGNRIHGHADHDQQRGAAEIEGHAGIADQELRQQTDERQIEGADDGDAGQHIVDVFRRPLARADARNEAAILLQIVRRLLRIEHDRGVEEREEDDQRRIEEQEQRLAVAEHGGQCVEPVRALPAREIGDRDRQQQQR